MPVQTEKKKVLCFGEVLLRMSPFANGGWIQQQQIPAFIGGAEANVATALAIWGTPAAYCTAMPDNYLGHDIDRYLQDKGIDTKPVHWSGSRIGIYYLQQGADLKHAGVVYDRACSSFSALRPGMIDWDQVLADVSWFHFSAISPALNEHLPAVCKEALEAASAKGITISVDLNYRAKLWQYGKRPDEVMPALVQYCDLVMGNIWAANMLLGIPTLKNLTDANTRQSYLEHAIQTSAEIMDQYPKCKAVANTFRFEKGAQGIDYYAALFADNQLYASPHFTTDTVTDKIGSGDCFMAGLIHGMYHDEAPQQIISYAAAAAFGKLNETGDATSQTTAQVQAIMNQYEQETIRA